MQLIDMFHRMESEEGLFEIGRGDSIPVWDIVRYSVYLKYYYPESDRRRLSIARAHSISEYAVLLVRAFSFGWRLLFAKGTNIVVTSSRNLNSSGKYFDRNAMPIIDALAGNCLITEPVLNKKVAYGYIYDFSSVYNRFGITRPFPREYFSKLNGALVKHFQDNLISYEEVNSIYHNFQSDYKYYKALFRIKNTRKLFVATGNPKGMLLAAQERAIETYLLQHAGIEFDEVDYSYPDGISNKSNILFPDIVLTFGEYWCRGINVPAKTIIAIGNDVLNAKPAITSDNSIVIISTIIHGGELRDLTRQLAAENPDLKINYKLHPNEFHLFDEYAIYFEANRNVTVVTDQAELSILIARSQLIILIVSAVLYEALHNARKVAVYKKLNYSRQAHMANWPNVYFFDCAKDVSAILMKPHIPFAVEFYKPTNRNMLRRICFDSAD